MLRAVPRVGTVVAAPEHRVSPSPRSARRRANPASEQELSRERIVRAALGIADAEGLSELSMRSVAAALGVPTMSLYRHVPGKEELVLLMADAAFAEGELPRSPPPGWRAQLERVMRLHWSLYHRHPWLARVLSLTRPQLLPSGMAHTEWVLRALDGLGLGLDTMLQVHLTLVGFVRGIALELEEEAEAEAETGLTSDEWIQTQEAEMARVIASGHFPMLSRVGELAGGSFELSLDTLFETGLLRLLDGLAEQLRREG
ncbi:MAG TPA: TetR/AcrR family transcriptional regulator [Archangium sp.]|uniref:TetR/AcrR family transcriptional regulator n=1 Tax=Archangium sp. TaxID=1872627 RepID=UPI002E33DD17|nr:TetR/AcrR family transcriptional regulator [Archangium sp.]HEX5748208.1 TetR/AcrR family transcriptional regulator [Archangium sp.]